MIDIPLFFGYTENEFIDKLPERVDNAEEKLKADITEKGGIKVFNVVQDSVRTVVDAHAGNGYKAPIYTYRFAPSVPGKDNPGAFHSCDLWFFFETVQKCWRPFNGMHYDLARKMCDYWCNFIRTSDPNGIGYDGRELPKWIPSAGVDRAKEEMLFK
jgi:para-nitrobenzyl esterase